MWQPDFVFIRKHPGWTALVSIVSFLAVLEGVWSLFSEKPFFVWLNAQLAPFGNWLWTNLYKWIAAPLGVVGFVILVLILWSLKGDSGRGLKKKDHQDLLSIRDKLQADMTENEIAELKRKLESAEEDLKTQIETTREAELLLEISEEGRKELRDGRSALKAAFRKYEMEAVLHTLNRKKEKLGLTATVVYVQYTERDFAEQIAGVFRHVGWTAETKMFKGEQPPGTSGPVLVQSGDEGLADTVLTTIISGGLLGDLSCNSLPDPSLQPDEVVITLFPKVTS